MSFIRTGAIFMIAVVLCTTCTQAESGEKAIPAALNFKMKSINGKEIPLKRYQGKVVLFVNVASQCGYTPQYAGLQSLHQKYASRGLAVLGIPCNQFGNQEPGTEKEIEEFCHTKYGVTFDMFSKVDVNGESQCSLYKFLTSKETNAKFAGPIKWNFEKFLVNRNGDVVGRYASNVAPDSKQLIDAIEHELAQGKQ